MDNFFILSKLSKASEYFSAWSQFISQWNWLGPLFFSLQTPRNACNNFVASLTLYNYSYENKRFSLITGQHTRLQYISYKNSEHEHDNMDMHDTNDRPHTHCTSKIINYTSWCFSHTAWLLCSYIYIQFHSNTVKPGLPKMLQKDELKWSSQWSITCSKFASEYSI